MPVVTAKVNRIVLNRGADLFFEGENVFVPMGNSSAKALPETLDRLAADVVLVEYRTVSDPTEREKDTVKFSRRLAGLGASWSRSDWRTRVIDGHVHSNVIECTLTRASV